MGFFSPKSNAFDLFSWQLFCCMIKSLLFKASAVIYILLLVKAHVNSKIVSRINLRLFQWSPLWKNSLFLSETQLSIRIHCNQILPPIFLCSSPTPPLNVQVHYFASIDNDRKIGALSEYGTAARPFEFHGFRELIDFRGIFSYFPRMKRKTFCLFNLWHLCVI